MRHITTEPLDREVTVAIHGEVVAVSTRAIKLDELGHPTRIYIPREDVRASVEPSDKRTYCPWKGHASYWTVGGAENAAWSYEDPKDNVGAIRGHLSFRGDGVEVQ